MSADGATKWQYNHNGELVITGDMLDKITGLMRQIVEQEEFWVDTITLTAASSPEGGYAFNDRLSQGRAQALKQYLVKRYGRRIDTLLTVKWIAEDWPELTQRIRTDKSIENREAILELIASEKNPDRREQVVRRRFPKDYAYIRSAIYPQLRAVNFRYSLRRKGMVKVWLNSCLFEFSNRSCAKYWRC